MPKGQKKSKKKLLPFIAVLLLSVVITLLLYVSGPLQFLEQRIVDELYLQRGALDISDSPIVIVTISQTADEEIPFKYPWPTDVHARLIKNLNRAGVAVIGFDVIFDEEDIYNPKNDTLFAEALSTYGNVFLAAGIKSDNEFLRSENRRLVQPIPILKDSNPNPTAFVETFKEIDGKVKRYTFGRRYNDELNYMLAWEMLRYYQGLMNEDFINTDEQFGIGNYLVKKDTENSFLINYHAPPFSFPMVSYEEVIDDSTFQTTFEMEAFDVNKFDNEFDGLLQQDFFKDKIVLVGATMPVLQDYHQTPFTGSNLTALMPGVEIHANAMQSILNSNYLVAMSGWFTLIITVIGAFIVILINYRLNYLWGISLAAVIIIIYGITGVQLFGSQNFLVVFTAPILCVALAQVGSGAYEYFLARKEKVRIQSMFSSYVSPKLVNQMINSGEGPKLGGQEQVVTAFFSDIASFSAFSEVLEPVRLVHLINEYLNEMTNILNDQGGTLDKYIGDAIVGIFGAPVDMEDHAYRACVAAQLMQLKQAELREKWAKEDRPEVIQHMRTRIGLNTGEMVTGNMGSSKRFNYTMMGDNVNLAARCESGAKSYGVYTMVTDDTRIAAEKVRDKLLFRYLDNIIVMGRKKPVKVHEIVAFREDETQQISDLIGLFQEGVDAYLSRDWDVAISKFQISAHLELLKPGMPGIKTNPSEMYIERCHSMKDLPSVEPWDGIFRMKTK